MSLNTTIVETETVSKNNLPDIQGEGEWEVRLIEIPPEESHLTETDGDYIIHIVFPSNRDISETEVSSYFNVTASADNKQELRPSLTKIKNKIDNEEPRYPDVADY